jgi:hypothetical protein
MVFADSFLGLRLVLTTEFIRFRTPATLLLCFANAEGQWVGIRALEIGQSWV